MKACLLSLLAVLAAPASALTDPTQPPAALQRAASAPAAAAAAPPVMRLQGLRPGHSALIDGQLRRVGQQWQGHQLLRADAQVAWLRDPEGRLLRLSLLPALATANEKKRP